MLKCFSTADQRFPQFFCFLFSNAGKHGKYKKMFISLQESLTYSHPAFPLSARTGFIPGIIEGQRFLSAVDPVLAVRSDYKRSALCIWSDRGLSWFIFVSFCSIFPLPAFFPFLSFPQFLGAFWWTLPSIKSSGSKRKSFGESLCFTFFFVVQRNFGTSFFFVAGCVHVASSFRVKTS